MVKNIKVDDNEKLTLLNDDNTVPYDVLLTADRKLVMETVEELNNNTIKITNENNELRKRLNTIGDKKMDDKDVKILEGSIEKLFNAKFDKMQDGINKKFDFLEDEIDTVKTKSEEVCADGKCFTKKLDSVNDVLGKITEVLSGNKTSEEISNVKTDVEKQISKITEDLSSLNSKIGEVCTGIDCIKKRFETEDDMYECPNCDTVFSLSANMANGTIVCPGCKNILEFDE